jgi:hypothetical protein
MASVPGFPENWPACDVWEDPLAEVAHVHPSTRFYKILMRRVEGSSRTIGQATGFVEYTFITGDVGLVASLFNARKAVELWAAGVERVAERRAAIKKS